MNSTSLSAVTSKAFLKPSLEMKPQDDGDSNNHRWRVFHSWLVSATGFYGREYEWINYMQSCSANL